MSYRGRRGGCRRRGGGGGCFIATEIYGSYDAPEVMVFRNFRDTVLNHSKIGRIIISIYYKFSPLIVKIMQRNKTTKKLLSIFTKAVKKHLEGMK